MADAAGPKTFAQAVYEACLAQHPELAEHEEAFARSVEYIVRQTHAATRRFVVEKAAGALREFYDATKRRRVLTARLRRSVLRNPALVHRNAVIAVEESSMAVLAGLGHVTDDSSDIPDEIGTA